MMLKLVLLKTLLINSLICVFCENNEISVQTKSGPIKGFTESFDDKSVNVFLGIPFAEPPVGEHRFRKPEPVKGWTEPLAANKWPNNCYQTNNYLVGYKTNVFSEDCLYLNIWSPNRESDTEQKSKPVILIIHGGGFFSGSSSMSVWDAKLLSMLGDVVVASFNYRLEAFGFLYADSDEAPGNMALWDQVMALQWVNDNIQYFGGNAKKITVLGCSAGSWSASLLLMSPHSQHLFQNAILESGAAYNYRSERTAEQMKQFWIKAATSIGCVEEQEYSYVDFTPQIMKCLKTVPPEKVLQLSTHKELSENKFFMDRLVVIDGQFLPEKPVDLLSDLRFNETKNILIGTVEDEGSILLSYNDQDKYGCNSQKNFTLEEAFKELSTLSSTFPTNLPVIGDEVSELYFFGLNENSDPSEIRQRIGLAYGDFIIQCPTMRFAEVLFQEHQEFINVYQYYVTSFVDLYNCPLITKASHGLGVYFIFGHSLLNPDSSERHKEVSKQMIELISHFARFGHPKSQNGIPLKPYYAITDRVMKPFFEISDNPKPNNNFGIGLKAIECDYLWNDYLDY